MGWATRVEEVVGALDQLVRDGKVRYLGCSNYSGWQLTKSLAAADLMGVHRFVSQRIHYSLPAREAEHELVPIAIDQGVGILVWAPLASGLLAGRWQLGVDDQRVSDWTVPPVHDTSRVFDVLDVVRSIAERHHATPGQVSLAYVLSRPGVCSAIVGPSDEARLEDALAAAHLRLGDDELAELDRVSAVPTPYPYWHQELSASDRLIEADEARPS